MSSHQKIVIVDDDEVTLTFCQKVLQDYETFPFRDPKKALQFCTQNEFDLILSDMRMPGMTGIGLVQEIRKKKTDFAVIILSAYSDTGYLMEAVNASNIAQYLVKPVPTESLINNVGEALRHLQIARQKRQEELQLADQARKLLQENTQLRFHASSPLASLVGSHPSTLKVKEQIKSFALSDHPILITGEEGTGKKLVARVIHELSSRHDRPFITVSTTTIPEDLLEVEIFGSVKNPLTGAKQAHEGFLERAEGGTLSIEDIQAFSKPLQSKFLKFLQYGTYYPVGGTDEKTADVRVICASKTSLLVEIDDGSFRKELYHKIANLQIKTLPLRDRRDDILALLDVLAKKDNRPVPNLTTKQKELLTRYPYPGNIRELQGILEKLSLFSGTSDVSTDEIERIFKENAQIYAAAQGESAAIKTIQLPTGTEPLDMRAFVDAIERDIIVTALRYNENNISQTSRNLMISRQGLKNKIKRYDIPVDDLDDEDA